VDVRRSGFKRLLGTIRKHTSGVRLLDVGAGPGYYLQIITESGLLAAGIEPSDDARKFGVTHYGVNYVSPSDVKPSSVDIILLRHVLEHIEYPIPFVHYLSSLLSPSGIVFVQVPIFQSPTQWLKSRLATGSVSCNLYGDEHISGFEANSLVKFLGLTSLHPVKVWSSGLYSYDYDPIFSRLFLDRLDYAGLVKKLVIGALEQPFTWFGRGQWICGIFRLDPDRT
jgi:SAM-dependent methyltransferase